MPLIWALFTNSVQADGFYLTTTETRILGSSTEKHRTNYGDNDKEAKIWKIATCSSDGKTVTYEEPDLYCVKADIGFASNSENGKAVYYNKSYNLISEYTTAKRDYDNSSNGPTTIFKSGEEYNFNAVMWILDNILLENASEKELEEYLLRDDRAGYNTKRNSRDSLLYLEDQENVLSRTDIEVIQQLAIWYFTNANDIVYHEDISGVPNLPWIYVAIRKK